MLFERNTRKRADSMMTFHLLTTHQYQLPIVSDYTTVAILLLSILPHATLWCREWRCRLNNLGAQFSSVARRGCPDWPSILLPRHDPAMRTSQL